MILIASVLFGTYGVWSKIMGEHFGIFYQSWVRALIIIIILLPLLIYKKQFKRIERKDMKWLWFFIGFSLFTQAPLYYAYTTLSLGTATLLFYGALIVASFTVGKFIIGEKITMIKVAAMILAFAGLTLVFGLSVTKFSILGLLMAALNGVASGAEVSSTKMLTHKYSALLLTFYSWVAIFVTHLIISVGTGERQWGLENVGAWGALFVYALASLAAFWLVVEGLRYVDASIGSLISLLEIIWAVLFGAVLFGEGVGPTILLGGIIIVAAGLLPDLKNIIEHRRKMRAVPQREM